MSALPLHYIRNTGEGFPLTLPANVDDSDQYARWSGGVVGTTDATVLPATLAEANACAPSSSVWIGVLRNPTMGGLLLSGIWQRGRSVQSVLGPHR
jgi:hypothetical protein